MTCQATSSLDKSVISKFLVRLTNRHVQPSQSADAENEYVEEADEEERPSAATVKMQVQVKVSIRTKAEGQLQVKRQEMGQDESEYYPCPFGHWSMIRRLR